MNTIIAAYAGTGKTMLANKYSDMFVDFICMPYKYCIDDEVPHVEKESCKANMEYELHEEWPYNYVEGIKNFADKTKIILIPTDFYVLKWLECKGIDYYICYPEKDAKEEYRKRFIKRGNLERFIDIFIGRWDNYIESFESDTFGKHIILRKGEYLEDGVKNIFMPTDSRLLLNPII